MLATDPGQQDTVMDMHSIATGEMQQFIVPLRDENGRGTVFESLQVVRYVPGRRVVSRGMWQSQSVYAKLFFGKRAQRDAARDLRGILALQRANIPTPALLNATAFATPDMHGEALVLAAVANAINAELAWQQQSADPAARFALARALVVEVARHHEAGLMQRDLYLKNFLLQGEQVYTLDGDGIRPLSKLLGRRQARHNLALLISKFDAAEDKSWMPHLLEAYAQTRPGLQPFDVNAMHKLVKVYRRRMMIAYADHKVLRQCTDVQVSKFPGIFMAVARAYFTETMQHALADIDRLLTDDGKRIKSGNTCTVGLAAIDGRKVVIKRYNIKNLRHGLNRALRKTRAAVSWSNAHRLLLAGIVTAAPMVLLERRWMGIRRQAYFLAEYVEGPDAAAFFADTGIGDEHKNIVADNLARLFYRLSIFQITHGDFKASNIRIAGTQPVLIDLDGMRMHRSEQSFRRQHVRDLRRFMRNWQHEATTRVLLSAALARVYENKRLLEEAGIVTRLEK
jgi:tRNA A-37 threonylcarbamoyl transferase component Bud32